MLVSGFGRRGIGLVTPALDPGLGSRVGSTQDAKSISSNTHDPRILQRGNSCYNGAWRDEKGQSGFCKNSMPLEIMHMLMFRCPLPAFLWQPRIEMWLIRAPEIIKRVQVCKTHKQHRK